MKPSIYLSFACFLLVCGISVAQSTNATGGAYPRIVLKASPLKLLHKYPTIQGAIEYQMSTHWALQAEMGYGYMHYHGNREVLDVRPQLRYYLFPQPENRSNLYVALEPFFTNARKLRTRTIPGARIYTYERYTTGGALLKIGIQFLISSRWLLDTYVGAGFRYTDFYHGQSASFEDGLIDVNPHLFASEKGYKVAATAGFQIGYCLWK